MRVKLVQEMSGTRNGEPWPGPGEVVDLSDDEANQMVATGAAVDPDQKHPAADARFAAKQLAAKQAEADQKIAADRAKADAKTASDRAAADQKAADDKAEAARQAAQPAAPQKSADTKATRGAA